MNGEDDNEDVERSQIRSELSSMSFEELQKLKEKLGAKVYNEAVFGAVVKKRTRKPTDFKRENKNRPREMSSKKPVPLVNPVSSASESAIRDPRFDSLCGTYNPKAFKKSYSFLTDIREGELKTLKKELENTEDPERQGQIKYLIQRMENQNREERKHKKLDLKKRQEYEEQARMMKEGKQPVYVRKSDKKVFDLVEQYEELKKTGTLEKHISKHRKRNAQKDRKNMSIM